ncbi:nuclear receptor-binding protein 2 isoform X1 [Balaenoptera musculus]|uniref:Nuclear receptor-binding protein 2 n=1 Tax=Balaenoptera musculus TaxID=9771 RepID=A0A8B8VLY9_BALMU|nr:nuclear receptor-binding protein 2 isoform X1 [Balaenoptera musculus]
MAAPEPVPRRGREREREDESEDESDILEESPCGRWQKRREQPAAHALVNQGNMPGVQSTFLAMDTEEGVEVVWNELHFADRKAFSAHEEKIQIMFEQLVLVDHPNIVKLHKYWLDASEARARVIFITEYVPSGSLKQFLKKTKKNRKAMNARSVRRQAWKRWCTQILSALSFLHTCSPPIIHGNLTSDTIFIQHNGLIKIGSVWHRIFSNALPDDLRSPIRAEREEPRNLHFFPPEYGEVADGTAVDIFSFGMCALEMAVLEIQANGDTRVTEEAIAHARHSLSDPNMREFILSCLARDPARRPSAHSLLFHRVLFEVHSLKLLAAHCFIQHQYLMPENMVEEKAKATDPHTVLAEIPRPPRPPLQWRYSEVSCLELDKFLEDVRNGIYPLMNFAAARPLGLPRVLAPPPEEAPKAKTPTPEPFDSETRKVIQMQCNLERSEDQARWHLTLLLVLEDRLHRQLTYDLLPTDSAQDLAAELVHYGFVHEVRTIGRSWPPSWTAPSSSTVELSRDPDPASALQLPSPPEPDLVAPVGKLGIGPSVWVGDQGPLGLCAC